MAKFKGVVSIDGNKTTLNAGGIKVSIEGDAAFLAGQHGRTVIIEGDQVADAIRVASPPSRPESSAEEFGEMQSVIAAIQSNLESLLSINGVITARPGFSRKAAAEEESGLIIVLVTDGSKIDDAPVSIMGIPVELQRVSPREILEGVGTLQDWLDSGLTEAGPPKINYQAPTHVSLKKHKVANILCHVGPDAGWTALQSFLEGTEESLTVAMYQFYAKHIMDTVTRLGRSGSKTLEIILQDDSKNVDTEDTLRDAWGRRLDFVNASTKGVNRLFSNSYHTKVAVRDSSAFWLSSGNWSLRSQPEVDPEAYETMYAQGNREWHVIIEDEPLARMYQEFIRYDIEEAKRVASMELVRPMPDLMIPIGMFMEARARQPKLFEPKKFAIDRKVEVTPLMSPDNYAAGVLKLINEATFQLYLQFSYINKPDEALLNDIIEAIAGKMREGIDVKVIVSGNQKPDATDILIAKKKWKRKMFRQQTSKLHNKGVIIDDRYAVVGSNNWSADGTQYNRDTSLIFDSPEIAEYYKEVFLFDWQNLTKAVIRSAEVQPMIAPETGSVPEGMVRVAWSDWFDD